HRLARARATIRNARARRNAAMTDIRRTLLWGIFLASLFFIWEAWNRHNGQPSMFGPASAARVATPSVPAPAQAPTASADVPGAASPTPTPAPVAATASPPVAAGPAASAAAVGAQQVTVT